METLRQAAGSLLLAIFSAALVIGGISLALAESYVQDIPTPTETQAQIPIIDTPTSQSLAFITETLTTPCETATSLYAPLLPTKTVATCGPPPGWISYTVRAGNTMYSISHAYSISVSELQFANCIPPYQYSIRVGQSLRVPNVAITRTPHATATPSLTLVSIIFPTLTHTPTSTPTATITPTATATATDPPPTATPTATATITSSPSPTPIP